MYACNCFSADSRNGLQLNRWTRKAYTWKTDASGDVGEAELNGLVESVRSGCLMSLGVLDGPIGHQTSAHRFISVDSTFLRVAQFRVPMSRPRSVKRAGCGTVSPLKGSMHALKVYGTRETLPRGMERIPSR